MSCKTGYINGWGDCQSKMKEMIGAGLQYSGASSWTEATAVDSTAWHAVIAAISSATRDMLMLPVDSFVNTTDEAEILTSTLGKKSKGKDPIPSGVIYLDASICDYKTLTTLNGRKFDFIPFFEDDQMWMTEKTDGTYKGFSCTIDTNMGLPPEDKTQSYPVYLFFNSYREFENVAVITTDSFSYDDLFDFSPVGLNMKVTTAYSAGDVTVKVTKRGSGDAMLGLTTASDFEVMKSNGAPVVATTVVVDNGQGSYTLTIKADSSGTPADLSSSEYVYLQSHDDDATYLTYQSQAVKLMGGA